MKDLIFALLEAAPYVKKEYCPPYGLLMDSAADALEAQQAEIAWLKQQLAEATKPASMRHMMRMEQQFAEVQKDADRYRWLRDSENQHIESDPCVSDDMFNTYFDTYLDEIIDALIARNKAMAMSADRSP